MAVMFPKILPDYVRGNPIRSGECRVYDALAEQLEDDYRVFYSSPWIGTAPDGEERDGEADFTIAHPDFGFLVVEVKGGRIEIAQDRLEWFSTDRNGIVHRIKNPVRQARQGKHNLLKNLKKRPEWTPRFIRARHAVLLPDTARPGRDLAPDMPLEIFGFSKDMTALDDWVTDRLAGNGSDESRVEALGLDGIRALKAMLADPIVLNFDLRPFVDRDVAEINALSDEQYWIIESIANANARVAVSGPAGSGKTVLAAKLVTDAAREGKSALLLCYNAPLASHLADRFSDIENLTICTFHRFVRRRCETAGIPFHGDRLADCLVTALATVENRYHTVAVDEGQDFESDWLESLELAQVSDNAGAFCVFYDNNQRIQARCRDYLARVSVVQVPLTRNFRNTKRIFHLSRSFYRGSKVVAIGPTGQDIRWVKASTDVDARQHLASLLGTLTKVDQIAPRRIAVLCSTQSKAAQLRGDPLLARYRQVAADARDESGLVIDSVRRFKGLESDIVVLFQPESYIDDNEMLYVAITRARALLVVLGNATSVGVLQSLATEVAA